MPKQKSIYKINKKRITDIMNCKNDYKQKTLMMELVQECVDAIDDFKGNEINEGILLEKWLINAGFQKTDETARTVSVKKVLTLGKGDSIKDVKNNVNVKIAAAPQYVQVFCEILFNAGLLFHSDYQFEKSNDSLPTKNGAFVHSGPELYRAEIESVIFDDTIKVEKLPKPIDREKYNKMMYDDTVNIDMINDTDSLLKLSLDNFGAQATHNDYNDGAYSDMDVKIAKVYAWMRQYAKTHHIRKASEKQKNIFFNAVMQGLGALYGEEEDYDF